MMHAEAFCLMTYRCEACLQTEVIWNSRDGVTPFVVGCRACHHSMSHIDWKRDVFAPTHTPKPGERFFRDATEDDLRAMWERRIKSGEVPRGAVNVEQAIRSEFSHGEPPPWLETAL